MPIAVYSKTLTISLGLWCGRVPGSCLQFNTCSFVYLPYLTIGNVSRLQKFHLLGGRSEACQKC